MLRGHRTSEKCIEFFSGYNFHKDEKMVFLSNLRALSMFSGQYVKAHSRQHARWAADEFQNRLVVYRLGGDDVLDEWRVLSNPMNFTLDEVALICDDGDLRYGFEARDYVGKLEVESAVFIFKK